MNRHHLQTLQSLLFSMVIDGNLSGKASACLVSLATLELWISKPCNILDKRSLPIISPLPCYSSAATVVLCWNQHLTSELLALWPMSSAAVTCCDMLWLEVRSTFYPKMILPPVQQWGKSDRKHLSLENLHSAECKSKLYKHTWHGVLRQHLQVLGPCSQIKNTAITEHLKYAYIQALILYEWTVNQPWTVSTSEPWTIFCLKHLNLVCWSLCHSMAWVLDVALLPEACCDVAGAASFTYHTVCSCFTAGSLASVLGFSQLQCRPTFMMNILQSIYLKSIQILYAHKILL